MDDLSKRIREAIGDLPLTEFAGRCGVRESTLRNILNGATPRADNLEAIAKTAGVTTDWLLTGRWIKYRKDLDALQKSGTTALLTNPRLQAIAALLEQLPPEDQDAILNDAFSRAQAAKQLADLRHELADLRKKVAG